MISEGPTVISSVNQDNGKVLTGPDKRSVLVMQFFHKLVVLGMPRLIDMPEFGDACEDRAWKRAQGVETCSINNHAYK